MKNKPLFFGMPGGIKNVQEKSINDLLDNSGRNTGNFLFVRALREILGRKEDVYKVRNYFLQENREYDYIAISAANWVNPGIDLSAQVDYIESTQLPCLVVGLGGHLPFNAKPPKLRKSTQKFLEIISERSQYISVRGEHTQRLLEHYGIYNTWVTGCPSILGDGSGIKSIENKTDIKDLSKVVLQGTRHGYSETIFKPSKINDINLEIYRFAMKNNMPLLLQSEVADMYLAMERSNNREINKKNIDFLQKIYLESEDKIKFYLQNKALLYWNLDDWTTGLSKYDFLMGTRIHGVISALLSGVPAVLLTHDERTQELAKIMHIPHRDIRDMQGFNEDVILNIIRDSDFSNFNENRLKYINNFKTFFQANEVENIL